MSSTRPAGGRRSPRDPDDVLVRLRAATEEQHRAVEDALDLLDPALTGPGGAERLQAVVHRLHGFHRAVEAQVDAAVGALAELDWLDWPARRKAPLAAADLTRLGVRGDALPVMPLPPLAPTRTAGAVLGRLYVAEGSTLGGQVIARHLAGSGVDVPSVLTPYGEDAGHRWQVFRAGTRAWVGADAARRDTVVEGAVVAFDALVAWCAPLRAGRAA